MRNKRAALLAVLAVVVLAPSALAGTFQAGDFLTGDIFIFGADPSFQWKSVEAFGWDNWRDLWANALQEGVAGIDLRNWIWPPVNYVDAGAPEVETIVSVKDDVIDGSVVPVPEPALILLIGIGTGAVGVLMCRRKR